MICVACGHFGNFKRPVDSKPCIGWTDAPFGVRDIRLGMERIGDINSHCRHSSLPSPRQRGSRGPSPRYSADNGRVKGIPRGV
jgi:hypothetical protein